jgi:hypothetical protein
MEKMANWPQALQEFKKTVDKAKAKNISNISPDRSSPFRLLRLIGRNNNNRNFSAIESNFLHAAFHIACMKELNFEKDECPDLTDELDALTSK